MLGTRSYLALSHYRGRTPLSNRQAPASESSHPPVSCWRIRFHDLRHTGATLLLAQGVHLRLIMEILGHSQIAIAMNL
jgi:integrase